MYPIKHGNLATSSNELEILHTRICDTIDYSINFSN